MIEFPEMIKIIKFNFLIKTISFKYIVIYEH